MDGEILLIFTFSQQDKRIHAGGVLPAFRGFSQRSLQFIDRFCYGNIPYSLCRCINGQYRRSDNEQEYDGQ